MTGFGPLRVLVLALGVLLVNLPLAHSWWSARQLDRSGVTVSAEVVGEDELPPTDAPRYWISYRLPAEIDEERLTRAAEVDRATYADAVAAGVIEIEVLPDDPALSRAVGRVTSSLGVWLTLLADAALIGFLVLALAARRRQRLRHVRMIAVCDVESTARGWSLEEGERGLWAARGAVVTIAEGRVVLDVGGGQRVTVTLDGHRNPVGHGGSARAIGRLLR